MSLKYISFIAAVGILVAGCVKNYDLLNENDRGNHYNEETDAQVKFINSYSMVTPAAIAVSATAASGPGFRILVDGQKIDGSTNTSASTNVMFYGNNFPATTAYTTIPSGQRNFQFVINRISGGTFAPIAGDVVFNTTRALKAGTRYSFFLADTIPNPSVFVVEDNYKIPAPGSFALRFINLSPEPAKRYDLTSARNGVLFTNVGYKEIRDFTPVLVSNISDTLYLRLTNTTTIVSQVNTFTGVSGRVYTFYARGKTGVSNRAPSLTFYTNR